MYNAAPQFIAMPRALGLLMLFSFQLSAFSFWAVPPAQFRITAEANQSAAGVIPAVGVASGLSALSSHLPAFPFPAVDSPAGPCVLGVTTGAGVVARASATARPQRCGVLAARCMPEILAAQNYGI